MRFHPPTDPDSERHRFHEFMLKELHLTSFMANALTRAGYQSLDELRVDSLTLLSVRGLGQASAPRIRGSIAAYDARRAAHGGAAYDAGQERDEAAS
jgi:DNA-directed RNA polymerase alpha subunit